jgi:hypothetical protein
MATVQDILQADSFAGNANLGGANAPAIQIDTRPLQQLALYTQFYNKTLYDQAVQDRDAKIKEVADVAKIDLNNVWGKDKDEMANDLNNLKIKAAEYAKKDTRSVQDELDWQTSIGDVMNKYNSAKQRAASYQAQLNDINSDPTRTSAQKDVLLKALNDKFDKTDISTPVSAATGYKPVNINLPAPVTSTVSAIKISADKNLATSNDISFFNPLASAPVAMNAINGVNSLMNNVSGVDKDLQATSNGEAQTWAGMKDALNSVIASKGADGKFKYFDDNNKFLYDKFKQDNASNTAIMQPVDAMMALTNYSQQHQNELKAGQFSDEGVNYNAPSTLSPDTFAAGVINITPDGVQANQLALAGMYAKYTGDKNEKKVTKLGLGIEQQNANTSRGRLNEEIRHNKVTESQNQPAIGSGSSEADNLINGVNLNTIPLDVRVAYHIPQSVVAIKNGAAIDKDGNVVKFSGQITVPSGAGNGIDNSALVEYNKVYGDKVKVVSKTEGVDKDGNAVPASTSTEVTKGVGNINPQGGVPVVFENGRVTAVIADDGTPIRSSQYEKIVNDAENKTVGSKQKVRSSGYGTSAYDEPQSDNNPANWKKLSNGNYQYKDGSIYNSKGKKIK